MNRYPWGLHGYHRPSSNGKVKPEDPLNVFGGTYDPNKKGVQEAEEEEARKAHLRSQIDKMYGIDNGDAAAPGDAAAAKAALEKDLTDVGDATRGYYVDTLNRDFTKAERGTRFNLARAGLLGGSADSDQQAEVRSDRDLGATRIDEAVRRAVASLQAQRESERMNAIGLVNAGVGDQAIRSAQSGLESSLSNANSQQRVELFGDLFANSADAAASQNVNAANAALLARYKQQVGSFFPATSTTGGRVTPTS